MLHLSGFNIAADDPEQGIEMQDLWQEFIAGEGKLNFYMFALKFCSVLSVIILTFEALGLEASMVYIHFYFNYKYSKHHRLNKHGI